VITTPVYCCREDVTGSMDVAATARYGVQIDREIQASSRGIDKLMRRVFYPTLATRTFDWLDHQYSLSWRLWLDKNELAAAPTLVTSGGVDITSGVMARPDDGPPYNRLEIDLSTNASFSATSTYQRAVSVTGLFGYGVDETPGGTISALSSTTQTTATVSDGALVGVGSMIRVDSERMIVTGKSMVNTGQTSATILPAAANSVMVQASNGTLFDTNDVIMIDGEKMRVDEIAGNQLVVKRAWDGSVLTAHDANAAIYCGRQVTLARGQLGTTAATHAVDATVNVYAVPSLIHTLCVAETMITLGGERSGYVNVITRGELTKIGTSISGIDNLRQRAIDGHQRKIRTRTTARHL
jgi:hypothetical protein